jgi:beta-propeller repeat-containing protein
MRYTTIALLLLAVAPAFAANQERSLPIFFILNAGQTDPALRYVVQTPEMSAGFADDSAIFQIHGTQLRVRFAGASPVVAIEGLDAMAARANFLIGDDPTAWHTGLPTYRGVIYRNLYPGIDMTYAGNDPKLKSEFLVAAGADPGQIRLEYPGADRVFVDANGDLVVGIGSDPGAAELREQAPTAYQEWAGVRRHVKAAYRVLGGNTVAFDLGAYDVTRPLVIDPVISYSTYLGGTAQSAVTALAVDTAGDLYAAGWTEAIDFPVSNAIQAVNRGGVDAFLFKLNPAGSTLLYATYIGGRGDDRAAAVAVDSSGQIYLAGSTASTNFPLVAALRPVLGGTRDAFVVKLNAVGNLLLYSTYLGGSGFDAATAIAVDAAGNAYIAGDTQSIDFPLLNPVQSLFGGATDVFVTKLSSAGAISFSSYLGGANDEHAGGIAVDSSGNIYVAGGTLSANFPLAAPLQAATGGSQDAFVAKISTSPAALVYSTYLGGTGGQAGNPEQANAIAVDSTGAAYIAGVTNSPNFPVTAGAFQTAFNGVQDAFVTKVNATGSAKLYSTYLGSSSFDWASGIAVDSGGNAYVAGYTSSAGFPVASGVQAGFKGFYDAFVSKLNLLGNGLTFSTMYGGTGADQANAIAVDTSGNMFVGGQTSSLDLPLQGAIQSSNVGGSTGWVARLGVTAPPPQVPAANSVAPSSGSGNTVTFTAQYSDPAGAGSLTTARLLVNTTASVNFGCYVTYSPATNLFTLANDDASTGGGSVSPGGGSLQNSQCTLNGAGSSVNLAGTNLTLIVSLSFQSNFAGNKTVYLYAADAGANTGFLAKGTWTVAVPPPMPSADSVSPNASSGAGQVFTFVFSDSQSASNLTDMAMLFNTSVSFTNACYIIYDRNAGAIKLLADDGVGAGSKPVGSTTVLQNSQCALGVASASTSGLSQILNISVTFKAAFFGLKNIFMFASEALLNTGWVQRGTYFVAAGGTPVANSVVPSAGSGPGQRFSFTVSDQGGPGFIVAVAMLFAPTLDLNNACSLVYDRARNTISLAFDNPANGAASLVPGSSTVVSNHQCTLRGANSTVTDGTTSLVITVDVTFNATYFGAKNTYLYAAETFSNSGYVMVGGWNVTGGAPTADSVNPASGSGLSPNFVFTVSDSVLDLNIIGMNLLVTSGSPANLANACYLLYNRTTSTIGLYSDNGVTLSTKGIGSATTLQNSQCAVGFTVVNVSGNSVSLTVNLVFQSPVFRGNKAVYLQALEPNASSGWVFRGTWTVP